MQSVLVQVFQLHMSLIAQLEALGHMAHWAVYVALHVPDQPDINWPCIREALVKELLMRPAPEWAADASKRDFLLHKLHLPPAWLDLSLAQWARYCLDDSGGSTFLPRTRCARRPTPSLGWEWFQSSDLPVSGHIANPT